MSRAHGLEGLRRAGAAQTRHKRLKGGQRARWNGRERVRHCLQPFALTTLLPVPAAKAVILQKEESGLEFLLS